MSQTIYTATPRKAREWAMDAMLAGLTPFIKGSPGIGKSAIMRSIAKEWNLELLDHRLSTSAPEDLSGLPDFERNGEGPTTATFRPFDLFPIEGTPLPKGKDGWLIFLDELNSAPKEVQAAAYKLILDRQVGQHNLHGNVMLAAAGNLITDKAIVTNLGTAMQSRLVHIVMEANFEEWWEDVALAQNYDFRVKGYLAWKKMKALMNFDPNHEEESFPCPRTWEFMHRMLDGKTFKEVTENDPHNPGKTRVRHEMDGKIGLFSGTIGQGEAVSFVQYCKVTHDLITIKEIVKDPTGAKVPKSAEMMWGQMIHVIEHVDDKNFADVCTYISRYDLTFRVLFFRSIVAKMPELKSHPAFIRSSIELAKYLYD